MGGDPLLETAPMPRYVFAGRLSKLKFSASNIETGFRRQQAGLHAAVMHYHSEKRLDLRRLKFNRLSFYRLSHAAE